MVTGLKCDYCGEEITEEPVRRGDKLYCSETCAFEATRHRDYGPGGTECRGPDKPPLRT